MQEKNVRIIEIKKLLNLITWRKEEVVLLVYAMKPKPVFKSTPTQFHTIIFASSDKQNVGNFVGDMSEKKLTERQLKILNLIKETPTISAKQMSETLSVSPRTIERDLSLMKKIGTLKREGKDNNGVWIISGSF